MPGNKAFQLFGIVNNMLEQLILLLTIIKLIIDVFTAERLNYVQ